MNAKQAIQAELREIRERQKERRERFERRDREDQQKVEALEKALGALTGKATRRAPSRSRAPDRGPRRPLTESAKMIVEYLREHGPTDQLAIQKALDMASSTTSSALRHLNGVVARERVKLAPHAWGYRLSIAERERETVTRPGEGSREGRLK